MIVINVHDHISCTQIGNAQDKVNEVMRFTRNESMELNLKKCKEMVIDFRRNKTVIPSIEIGGHVFARVNTYKLLGSWIDDNLK